jgi:predicted dehydrogenase
VCDVIEEKAKALAKQYATPYYLSLEILLQESEPVDVVVICTPNGLHAQHAILSLQKGYHVLVEKPMCIHTADGNRMIAASALSGKHLFTVVQNRFNPPVLAVKNALDTGMFGKVYSIQLTCFWNRNADYYVNSWKGTKELDGGTLFTQFSHFIDLLYWFFGDVKNIHAISKNIAHKGVIDFEDSGVVALAFENGIIGTVNFSVNSFEKNREGSLTILGEKGVVKIGGEYLNTIEYSGFEKGTLQKIPASGSANDYGTYQGSMSNHDQVYKSLIDSLQNGKPFYATPLEGLKTVEIIERMYQSAQNHNT